MKCGHRQAHAPCAFERAARGGAPPSLLRARVGRAAIFTAGTAPGRGRRAGDGRARAAPSHPAAGARQGRAGARGVANQRRPRPCPEELEPPLAWARPGAAAVGTRGSDGGGGGDGVPRCLCRAPGLCAALPARAPRPAVPG